MLQEIFYWIFNMSITACITGLLLMLIRSIKKIPRRFTVFLWLIPFIRMAVPFGINTGYSLMGLLSDAATRPVIVMVKNYNYVNNDYFSVLNHAAAKESYLPVIYKTNVLDNIFAIASVVWIIVALAIMLMLITVYFTTMRQLKDAKRVKDNVYFSDKVDTPAVYGILRPKIVLPYKYSDKDIDMILLHERAHIRRADNLWRMLAFIITAVHWFNPLAWVFLKMVLNDLELACDERVLAGSGAPGAKEYAACLLECKQGPNVFTSAFGGAKIKTRIEHVLNFKKASVISLAVFTVFAVVIAWVLLTN